MTDYNNPYRDGSLYVGRNKELEELSNAVEIGHSVVLIGGRKSGKTSLLKRLNNIDRRLILTSVDAWQLVSEELVISQIGILLGAKCGSRAELEAVFHDNSPLCLIIDDADRLLNEPWSGEFLAWLRYLDGTSLRTGLSIVLSGGPILDGYRNPDDKQSPVLNLSERLYLSSLDEAARVELAKQVPTAPVLDELSRAAGGHPWILQHFLREMWEGASVEVAWDRVYQRCHHCFETWRQQLGVSGQKFLEDLGPEGVPRVSFSRDNGWRRRNIERIRCEHLCMLIERNGNVCRGPALFLEWLDSGPILKNYDIAISYAAEDEDLARNIYNGLRTDINVFFAPAELAWLWGNDLNTVLPKIYGVDSKSVLVVGTDKYLQKHWTQIEYEAALSGDASILFVGMTSMPEEFPSSIVYLEGSPANLVCLLEIVKTHVNTSK